jgi:CPA1 family monovalent cation:H+ antiporter
MHEAEIIELVLGLLVVVVLAVTVSRRLGIPYPILLVGLGILIGLFPGMPQVDLAPDLVFLLFLPPILFGAGFLTSVRDFRANLRPILLLAVGLVLVTTLAVGVVMHSLLPSMGWAPAFALGAIVSPPDAVAATSIAQRLGLPRRAVTVLEGESLVNDATALVALRFAVAAALTGVFSLRDAVVALSLVAAGGVLLGLAVGLAASWLLRRLNDPPVEVTVSMLLPFAAFLPAEELGVSGVLAVVSAGLLIGYRSPRIMSSETRMLGSGAWQMLLFLLNGLVFILIGLQLPSIMARLSDYPAAELVLYAAAVSTTVVAVRILWIFPATYLPRRWSGSLRARDPSPPWRSVLVIGWAGMRGVVSLAAALSLPLTLPDGQAFPERSLIIFLTFVVILVTLVGQGLTLPLLIRGLGVADDGGGDHEEAHAREAAVAAARGRIEALAEEWPQHEELIAQLRVQYGHRAEHLGDHHAAGPTGEPEQELLDHRIIRRAVIDAEREAVIALRDRGAISDEAMRRVERDLDLEELRLEA